MKQLLILKSVAYR